jgi:hypothetical protein
MKVSSRELVNRLQAANNSVPVGSTFRHYKGGTYKVTDLVINENTQSVMVVYASTVDIRVPMRFVRPVEEWYEKCPKVFLDDPFHDLGPLTFQVPRFEKC